MSAFPRFRPGFAVQQNFVMCTTGDIEEMKEAAN
jgi:hypothetical protein